MGEDVLTNGRPADGVYFLTTNGEEPRSYNSYEQWIENWESEINTAYHSRDSPQKFPQQSSFPLPPIGSYDKDNPLGQIALFSVKRGNS